MKARRAAREHACPTRAGARCRSCATPSRASASPASPPTRTSSSAATRSTTWPPPAPRSTRCPTALLDVTGLDGGGHVLPRHARQAGRARRSSRASGKYKNAPNQFTEKRLHRAAPRADGGAARQPLRRVRGRASRKARGKTRGGGAGPHRRAGPTTAVSALKAGLVDELLYEDQLEERLKDAERADARALRASAAARLRLRRPAAGRARLRGGRDRPGREPGRARSAGAFAGSDTVAAALRAGARGRRRSRPSSCAWTAPGGSGTASDVIWREVALARKQKPVVVSMGDVAASGGYYIAMGSDAIVAQPGHDHGLDRRLRRQVQPARPLRQDRAHQGDPDARRSTPPSSPSTGPGPTRSAARIRALMVAFYEDFVQKAAEGRKQDAATRSRAWPRAASGPAPRRCASASWTSWAGSTWRWPWPRRGRSIAQGPGRPRWSMLPERKGLLETILERQEEGARGRSCPRTCARLLRWARAAAATAQPIARLPFELRIR